MPQVEQVTRATDGLVYDPWKMNSVLPRVPIFKVCLSIYIIVFDASHRKNTKTLQRMVASWIAIVNGNNFASHCDIGEIRGEVPWS
jgi:hypothetical protein